MRSFVFILVLCGVMVFSAACLAENPVQCGDLVLVVTGFKSNAGQARIQVMDSERAVTNESISFCMIRSRIVNQKVEIVLKGVPYGQYAVQVFHDVNGNGVIDKNIFGVPKEEYGFSNNVRGKLGHPDYADMRFELKEPLATQQISVQ